MKKLSVLFIMFACCFVLATPSFAGSLEKMGQSTNDLNNSTAGKVEGAAPEATTASGDTSGKSAIKTTPKFQERSWHRGPVPFGRRQEAGSTESAESPSKPKN